MPVEYICLFNLHKEDLQSGVTEKWKENTEKGEKHKRKTNEGEVQRDEGENSNAD